MLEIKNMSKSYGDQLVLKNINATVEKGDVIAIIGGSGSGKSTLLRCIDRLCDVSSGEILFNGENIKNISFYHQKVGMVFQQFNLFPNMTVLENIILAPVKQKIMDRNVAVEKALNLLSSVGLLDKKDSYPKRLSGGEKQRVAIVRTLIMNPDIILFDEPTSALDPEMVGEVLDLIRDIADKGMTMIIVSHEMNFVRKSANRLVFMDNGKISFDGSVKEGFANKDNERLKEFLSKTKDK
ncbi:MAG: amino acid ABC transporter ATP-binding protein [Bacilli bacterium]|nr:amino acid ABC transporter ATP-binding protein [Bacilli bacterium]